MSLGTKLKQLRQNKNWSQADAAYRLDISQPAYNKWETDQAKPNIDKLGKIAEVFETDIYELLENIYTVNFPNATFENIIWFLLTPPSICNLKLLKVS
jgi:transcriptional regulator with XRE-family HTH domain